MTALWCSPSPAPPGWQHAPTVFAALETLATGTVERLHIGRGLTPLTGADLVDCVRLNRWTWPTEVDCENGKLQGEVERLKGGAK